MQSLAIRHRQHPHFLRFPLLSNAEGQRRNIIPRQPVRDTGLASTTAQKQLRLSQSPTHPPPEFTVTRTLANRHPPDSHYYLAIPQRLVNLLSFSGAIPTGDSPPKQHSYPPISSSRLVSSLQLSFFEDRGRGRKVIHLMMRAGILSLGPRLTHQMACHFLQHSTHRLVIIRWS